MKIPDYRTKWQQIVTNKSKESELKVLFVVTQDSMLGPIYLYVNNIGIIDSDCKITLFANDILIKAVKHNAYS